MDEARSQFIHERMLAVLKDEFGLGKLGISIMQKWMKKMATDDPDDKLKRVRSWLYRSFQ